MLAKLFVDLFNGLGPNLGSLLILFSISKLIQLWTKCSFEDPVHAIEID